MTVREATARYRASHPERFRDLCECGSTKDIRAARCQPCWFRHRATRVPSLADRYWSKVDRRGPDECWPWLAATARNGYGKIAVEGRLTAATHVALALDGRPVPPGAVVRHSCDNPPCVNPGHLTPGSPADNSRDTVVRGRAAARLTRDDVVAIKRALQEGVPRKELAASYGMSYSTIAHIAEGRSWRHVR